jgi:hypothetical protein
MQTQFFQTVRQDIDTRAAGPQCVKKLVIDPIRMTGMSRAFAIAASAVGDALPPAFVGRKPYYTTDGGKTVRGGTSL